jgi:DNA-binding beta-propeller fold protein YncE
MCHIGVSFDSVTSNVYVGDFGNHRVRMISPTGQVTSVAGSGTAAYGDGLGAAANFNYPHGVHVDLLGNIFVADNNNNRVRKIVPSGMVTTLVGSNVAGGANGYGTAAQLNGPTDVALDSSGTMGYIVEQIGHRVRSFSFSNWARWYFGWKWRGRLRRQRKWLVGTIQWAHIRRVAS